MENKNPNIEVENEVSLSEILQVRRDKLKALQDKGQDPYVKTKYDVADYAKDVILELYINTVYYGNYLSFASISKSDKTISDFVIAIEDKDSKVIMYMAGKIKVEE